MRTQQEILERIKQNEENDFFGVKRDSDINFLEYDNAKPFLKEGVTKKDWDHDRPQYTRATVLAQMLDYMPFAWGKANDMRGISANRSMDHFEEWIWLLTDDDVLTKVEDIPYEHYGKERLIAICEHYGWDWKQWDDGVRTNGQ